MSTIMSMMAMVTIKQLMEIITDQEMVFMTNVIIIIVVLHIMKSPFQKINL